MIVLQSSWYCHYHLRSFYGYGIVIVILWYYFCRVMILQLSLTVLQIFLFYSIATIILWYCEWHVIVLQLFNCHVMVLQLPCNDIAVII